MILFRRTIRDTMHLLDLIPEPDTQRAIIRVIKDVAYNIHKKEKNMIRAKRFLFLFLIPSFLLSGCTIPAPKICIKGNSCLLHDIQFTEDTTEALRWAISNLTEKFHKSFPECDGNIIHKEGEIIHMDMGLDKKILPCMRYNIFENETDLITEASVRNVRDRTSEAEISGEEKSNSVRKGFGVRTR